jgi:hypothetical protein
LIAIPKIRFLLPMEGSDPRNSVCLFAFLSFTRLVALLVGGGRASKDSLSLSKELSEEWPFDEEDEG